MLSVTDENPVSNAGQIFPQPIAANIEVTTSPPASCLIKQYVATRSSQNDSYGLEIISEAAVLEDQRMNTPKSDKVTPFRRSSFSLNNQEQDSLSKNFLSKGRKNSRTAPKRRFISPKSRMTPKGGGRMKRVSSFEIRSPLREALMPNEPTSEVTELPESPLARLQPIGRYTKRFSPKIQNSVTNKSAVCSESDIMADITSKINCTPPGTTLVINPSRPRKRKPAGNGGCRKPRRKRSRV